MIKPNLFIVGAPKSGTTALRSYLADNPSVFACKPDEPHFFSTDLPGRSSQDSLNEYLRRYFCKANSNHSIIIDKSTWYLYSKVAVENILQFNPDAKFVAMIRNPVDMVYSLHSQLLYTREEDKEDFTVAWNLQGKRLTGQRMPRGYTDASILQYGDICKTGQQLKRLLKLVPQEKVMVIYFEDFISSTEKEYRNVLKFLGLPYDGRKQFPKVNENRVVRYKSLDKLLSYTDAFVPGAERIKRILGIRRLWLGVMIRWIRSTLLSKAQKRVPLSAEMNSKLVDYFRDDILLLSDLTGRDLSDWLVRK